MLDELQARASSAPSGWPHRCCTGARRAWGCAHPAELQSSDWTPTPWPRRWSSCPRPEHQRAQAAAAQVWPVCAGCCGPGAADAVFAGTGFSATWCVACKVQKTRGVAAPGIWVFWPSALISQALKATKHERIACPTETASAWVLHRSAAGAFAQVVQPRHQHGLAVGFVGEHAQFQLVGVGQRIGGQFRSSVGASTFTHCSGALVRRSGRPVRRAGRRLGCAGQQVQVQRQLPSMPWREIAHGRMNTGAVSCPCGAGFPGMGLWDRPSA